MDLVLLLEMQDNENFRIPQGPRFGGKVTFVLRSFSKLRRDTMPVMLRVTAVTLGQAAT